MALPVSGLVIVLVGVPVMEEVVERLRQNNIPATGFSISRGVFCLDLLLRLLVVGGRDAVSSFSMLFCLTCTRQDPGKFTIGSFGFSRVVCSTFFSAAQCLFLVTTCCQVKKTGRQDERS